MLVKIIENSGKITKMTGIEDADTIIIIPPKKGAGNVGWKPKFKRRAILEETNGKIFKKNIRYLMVRRDAEECINFDPDIKDIDVPPCTRKDIKQLFKSQTMHAAAHINVKAQIGWPDYVTIGLLVFLLIMNFVPFR